MTPKPTDSPSIHRLDRFLCAIAVSLVCAYFLLLAFPTLKVYFTPDDCMNLYRSWAISTGELIKANLLFFLSSPFQRPFGSVYYALIYHFTGFHATWFHIVALGFLSANIPLAYSLARRLSNSRFAAVLTCLFAAYQARFTSLYFDTGFIYDVLCYFFTIAALLTYVRIRQSGRSPNAREVTGITLLFICGLNSKEMAVMLPAFLLLYEAIYHPARNLRTWLSRPFPLALCLVSLLFVIGRSHGSESLITQAAYRPQFTWHRFMQTSQGFFQALTAANLRPQFILIIWALTAALAIFLRSRALIFAWAFVMLSPLPIAFISPRGGPQYYIPLFGCALYAGVFLTLVSQAFLRLPGRDISPRSYRICAAALFGAFLAYFYPHFHSTRLDDLGAVTIEAPRVASIVDQLHALYPTIPHDAKLLFLDDPYPSNWENMIFVVQLSYRDDSLTVKRVKQMPHLPDAAAVSAYHIVLDYRAGRFTHGVWPRPAQSGPAILVLSVAGASPLAEAYHEANWQPVSASQPARPGERIIIKATDLGATNPPVCRNQVFPQDPLARVAGPVTVHVNGRAANVEEKLGWPGEHNIYRVDVRLPAATEPGLANVDVSVGGQQSEPAAIRVRR
jgi:uncharacterized protein (TIGR03437 family)